MTREVRPKAHLADVSRTPHGAEGREGFELLDRNEWTVDFPSAVMEDLRRLVTPFLLRAYPEPEPLYRKLASWLGLPRDCVLLTMGADGGLRSVCEAFVEPGDEVVTAAPSYGMYPVYAKLTGASLQEVRFDSDLTLPLPRILERIGARTKLVVLANPNQPIERVYEEGELRQLLSACAASGALLVMDEAYHHFCPLTAAPLLWEQEHLVVIRSFSKAFGLAGLRLGYCVGRPGIIAQLTKVRPLYEANAVAIAFGGYLLDHQELMTAYVAEVKQAMAALIAGLKRLGVEAAGQWSNSVLATLPRGLEAPAVAAALKRRGILVRVETQAPLSNHLRITMGTRTQAQRVLAALESILAAQGPQHVRG